MSLGFIRNTRILRVYKNAGSDLQQSECIHYFSEYASETYLCWIAWNGKKGRCFCFKLFIQKQTKENFPRSQYCHCGNFLMLLQQTRMCDEVQHCVNNYSIMTGRLSNFPYKPCNLQDLLWKEIQIVICFTRWFAGIFYTVWEVRIVK
jgi:ligand-binding SRPBCC domain-containing protein